MSFLKKKAVIAIQGIVFKILSMKVHTLARESLPGMSPGLFS